MTNPANAEVTRRELISRGAGAAAGLGLLTPELFAQQSRPAGPPPEGYPEPRLPYGILGRTKYPATLVSFGAILLHDKLGTRLLRAGIDRGINLVHTSASYGRGKSVKSVGALFKAEKAYRDRVFLCIKSFHPEKESEIDDMLRALGTDHADVVITTFHKPEPQRLEAIQKQQDQLKKKGKVRHTGFVCHVDMNGVIEMLVDKAPDYFDLTLMAMRLVPVDGVAGDGDASAEDQARFMTNLKALREKGVGILSMKSGARKAVTQGGKVFEPHVKVFLEAGADTMLTSIDSFDQIDMIEKLNLKSPHPTPEEKQAAAAFLDRHATACLMCGNCTKACPQSVPVSDLMRLRMYWTEYGWHDHARAEFEQMGRAVAQSLARCGDCTDCAQVCPVNLASGRMAAATVALFG